MTTDSTSTPETPKRSRLSSGIVAAGAAFAMTLAGLGVAAAQTDGSTPPADEPATGAARHKDRPAPLADLAVAAEAIGVTEAELRAALRDGRSIADVARSNNVDVQKVIDALVAEATENLPERITAMVNRQGMPGPGRGHRHGHGHHRPGLHMRAQLEVAAEAIGVTPAELRDALREGRSIADVARSEDVDVQKVIDALVAEAEERLAAKVAAGDLTQAEADEKAAALAERITEMVNRSRAPAT